MDALKMTGDRLRELEDLARDAQADAIAAETRTLAERAAEGRFHAACVGQFKRGKSTLLNALVGFDVLPAGVVPVTSVPTVLRYGDPPPSMDGSEGRRSLSARIQSADGVWTAIPSDSLVEFVAEERNPGNEKGVRAVEVFVPSPLLRSGLCLVDTPGLGSVFEANTASTRAFLPQIDAALVVLGADPPLSGEELALVQEIAREVPALIFVLNKADRVSERERMEAEQFARRVLAERIRRPVERVFHVSALNQLESGTGRFDWNALVEHLQALAHYSGRSLVASAVRRGTARLGLRLQHLLTEEAEALQRPIEETEQRLRALRTATDAAVGALQELGPLFAAEEQRLAHAFSARRTRFLQETMSAANEAVTKALQMSGPSPGPARRRRAYEIALKVARELVEPWLHESERRADEAYRSAAARFADLADDLLARLRSSEAWSGLPLPHGIASEEGLQGQRHFYFHQFHHLASPAGLWPLLQWLADLILPRGVRERRIEHDAREYLRRVLETNAARVENDLRQRLHESRGRLESRIRGVLGEAVQTTERAMERAREAHAAGQEATQRALAEIDGLRARLARLLVSDSRDVLPDGRRPPAAQAGSPSPAGGGAPRMRTSDAQRPKPREGHHPVDAPTELRDN
jgi:hypothetical protein